MSDTTKRIIYKQDDGIAAIIVPATNCDLTVEQIAKKDVPTGKKYKIVDDSDIPANKNFRDAWIVDEADLTDGVGA